jgi:hypothetical protein
LNPFDGLLLGETFDIIKYKYKNININLDEKGGSDDKEISAHD